MEKRSPASGNKSRNSNFRSQIPFFLLLFASLSLAATFPLKDAKKENADKGIRKAAVAGSFYPEDPTALMKSVDQMLRKAAPPAVKNPILALMVPHAGYIFSGPVAAQAYKELEGHDIKTAILIGNSHHHYFKGLALYAKGAFETPLGLVPIDEEFAAKLLAADPAFTHRPDIHAEDHVLEVQLPFLQRVLKDFKIVPILFSGDSPELAQKLADILAPLLNDEAVILASTDLSHYPPYAEAVAADMRTLAAIQTGNTDDLDATLKALRDENIPRGETFLCSPSGVRVAMILAKSDTGPRPVLLKYANSGDSAIGRKKQVVGYGAVAFLEPPIEGPPEEKALTPLQEQELLEIARSTVESYVKARKIPVFLPAAEALKQPLGAFVTLKKNGALRGCIGQFEASEPLYMTVQQMAISAATRDPRFSPVSVPELDQLEYEISVLSPLRKVASAKEIVMGKHGVTVSKGSHHGVFLPQVAAETGWSKKEFLSELCSQKAGLPGNCWKDPSVELEVFTAEVFPEEKKER